MARVAVKSAPITSDSRLGMALIILGGGRVTEAMRTHGVSKSSAYGILHEVVDAISNCKALDLPSENDLFTLSREPRDLMCIALVQSMESA